MREKIEEALKFDERIWRAYQVLKPIHRDGLINAIVAAATASPTSGLTTEARALLEGITGDGDWRTANGKGSASVVSKSEKCAVYLNVRTVEVKECVERWQRDASFIASAPSLVRRLVARVQELENALIKTCDIANKLHLDNEEQCAVCGWSFIGREHAMGSCPGPVARIAQFAALATKESP